MSSSCSISPCSTSSSSFLDKRLGFVGAGQMARALARGVVRAGLLKPAAITAFDPVEAAGRQFVGEIAGAHLAGSNAQVIERSDVVILAVKPQNIADVGKQLRPIDSANVLVISILAGTTLADLGERLGTQRVVRVMPNTPCLVGLGASGFACGTTVSQSDRDLVQTLLQAVGVAFPLDEKLLDAVTGLSGSGPAFVFTIIEALSDGGVRMGLPRATATALAAQTLRGAAEMVLTSTDHPAVLRDRVASPGGTTIAGLQALEEHGLRAALIAAVQKATERSQELSRG